MQRNLAIIMGSAIVAILIGVGIYLYAPVQFFNAGRGATSTSPFQTLETVSFRVLDTDAHAADIAVQKNYAVYSAANLEKLWKLAHGSDETTPPAIDFSKEYVIGVFAGQKPTGGYSVVVTSVTDMGNSRTLAVTVTKPGAGCTVSQEVTSPYQFIAVPASDATLGHTDSEVATPCK